MKIKFKILDVLFICIILNLIPTAMLGLFKISSSFYTMLYVVIYIIQTLLLFFALHNKLSKVPKYLVFLFVLSIINFSISFVLNIIKFGNFNNNDAIFIISSIINFYFLIVAIYKANITPVDLNSFLKKIIFIGIISAIINFILNYKGILNISSITNSYNANFSSFFPNRNQYGLFMLMVTISLSLLFINEKITRKYIFVYVILIINLILSMSRNSMLGLFVFAFVFICYKYVRERAKITKRKIFTLAIVLLVFIPFLPTVISNVKISNTISTLFIRGNTLESGSGRFDVWKNGIYITMHNNPIFGVGRYKALELNKILFNNDLSHFHSMYVEKFVSSGFLGLIILILLLRFVWKTVDKMNSDNVAYKNVLKAALVTFWIISIFETTTRFSIGYADFMFLVFFFTLPILISNMKGNTDTSIIAIKNDKK